MKTKKKKKLQSKEPTLRLKRPFGYSLGLALIFLSILLVLLETAARSEFIQAALPAPSLASGHRRMDLKIALLNDIVKKEGQVDCIFLGGSNVNAAINPPVFSQAYQNRSGKKLICFNFGIDGLVPTAAAIMAEILIEKYQPEMLIWGISPGIFSEKFKKKTKSILLNNPWCRYWLKDFNFEGWLTEYSQAYRYFLRFRIWLEWPQYSKKLSEREAKTSKYGYKTLKGVVPFNQDAEQELRYRRILSNFRISKDALAGLEKILRLNSRTKIVIVEIPIYLEYLSAGEEWTKNVKNLNYYINRRAGKHGVLFIPTSQFNLIPYKGFRNIGHMNTLGAKKFSLWLGRELGQAAKKGFK